MKKFVVFLLLTFPALMFGVPNPDSLFVAANDSYSDGKYELALDQYMNILDEGFESSELYYNMGNAAYRSNKLGYAILYYKKALKLDPSFEEAEKNLAYVSIFKEDKLESVPEFFLGNWIRSLYRLFTLKTWSIVALGMFALLLFGTITYIFAPSLGIKKMGFFAGLVGLFLFVLSISGTLHRNKAIVHPENGVIVAPSVLVKSTPSDSGTDLFILHEGSDIVIDETVGKWVEVRISDGRIGWIPSEVLELI